MNEAAYETILPALQKVLGPYGWTIAHSFGAFDVPPARMRQLAASVARLDCSARPYAMWRPAPPSVRRAQQERLVVRNAIAEFLLETARIRRPATILGV